MEHEPTPQERAQMEKEAVIMKEMMPYFIYMMIPLAITIIIAVVFAPNMTLP